MASNVGKLLAADGVERGRQVHALLVQLLLRGADPAKLDALLADLSVPAAMAPKFIEDAQKRIQSKRHRDTANDISKHCLRQAATEVGVSLSHAFTFYRGDEILHIPIPDSVVNGYFIQNSLALVVSESGVGKTFWCTSLAVAVTTAQATWMDATIPPPLRGQPIIYALAEGTGLFKLRVVGATRHALKDDRAGVPDTFVLLPQSMHLQDDATVDRFIADAAKFQPCMVVVDTYQRHGGDEGDEVNVAIEHLTRIKEELACLVIGVHHQPKDGRQTPRGHGSLDGSADTVVYLTKNDTGAILARFEQRDLEGTDFWCQTVPLVLEDFIDPHTGQYRSTLVLERCAPQQAKQHAKSASKQDDLTKAILAAAGLTPGISQSELCKAVGGKKTTVIAEVRRMVGAGELLMDSQRTAKGGTKNTFTLPKAPF